MPLNIIKWETIKHLFVGGDILIGNGASIAVDPRFSYSSLMEVAHTNHFFHDNAKKLFSHFQTDDFELVLRLVWQATNVNIALDVDDQKTSEAYKQVRDALIQSVRASHPEFSEINEQIPAIYNFLKQFKTVVSLNYDLIIYWTMMYGLKQKNGHVFKDCFIDSEFYDNWRRLRRTAYERSNTLVFYPHGNLILARSFIEKEIKLRAQEDGLLETILSYWQAGEVVPLFVSEGTSSQKKTSIQSSYYLSTVYREVLPMIGKIGIHNRSLVIFGWGFGEHDLHILEKITAYPRFPRISRIAISVYGNNEAYCHHVIPIVYRYFGRNIKIYFFDSNSDQCWNNL